ncbi:MAG TPA: hypothetical protein VJP02_32015 [Candidatus Sulfotelmatobacter sp.]|nr:hypothetical protein [Candidatus Sulfotelmatobacter sp.]
MKCKSPFPASVTLVWRKLTGTGSVTENDVEPIVSVPPPSGFVIVAVSVAVPAVRPFTTTFVLVVNVPVGLTIEAPPEIESEIAVVLFEGLTVAVVVAVCPTATPEIFENETLGVTLSFPPGYTSSIGQIV